MYRILIYLEKNHVADCLDLVGAAQVVANSKEDVEIYGVGINLEEELPLANLDVVIDAKSEVEPFDVAGKAKTLEAICQSHDFDCILICATAFGRMLAPRLAMKLKTGLVADVTELECDGEKVTMIRPAFSGQMMAKITCDQAPIMMSIRPKVFKDDARNKKKPSLLVVNLAMELESGVKHLATDDKRDSSDIRDSKLLVSCGGGMGSDLSGAEALAKKLGGKLSVSRRPVDAGLVNRQIQVGQSGKIVSSTVYLALGISGSVQHIDGIKNVESIVSVNTDKHAPLNHLSELVVVGDGHEFVEKLLKRMERDA